MEPLPFTATAQPWRSSWKLMCASTGAWATGKAGGTIGGRGLIVGVLVETGRDMPVDVRLGTGGRVGVRAGLQAARTNASRGTSVRGRILSGSSLMVTKLRIQHIPLGAAILGAV